MSGLTSARVEIEATLSPGLGGGILTAESKALPYALLG